MLQYDDINGHEYPIFQIYDLNNNLIKEISLDYCGSGDLVEEYEFEYIKYQSLNYTEKVETKGCMINFILDYKEYSSRNDMDKVKELLKYVLKNINYNIYLIPHSEFKWRKFLVNPANDKLSIKNIMMQGTEGVELIFRTVNLVTDINWINPDTLPYTILHDFVTYSV